MLRDSNDGSAGWCVAAQTAKRSGRHSDLEQEQAFVKRLKKEVMGPWWSVASCEQAVEDGPGFLTPAVTPAATPAYAGAAAMPETISSPYSEAEDYMVRGYYEEDLRYDSGTCVESVQYNLYDMTPEELEHVGEEGRRAGDQQTASATAWNEGCSAWQQQWCGAELRCANYETVYEDSYDIDM